MERKYVLVWKVTLENLADAVPKTSLAEKVKNHVLSDGKLYASTGIGKVK